VSLSVAHRLALAALLAALTVAYLEVGDAGAEQSGRDGIVVSFDAQLSPKTLPRGDLAPVSISLSGGVQVEEGVTPPRLGRIELAFGARGGLETAGLPTCPRARLRNATHSQALQRCRGALIGRGSILTEVPLAPQKPLLVHASALAFNARKSGAPAVWVYAYSASPPVSFVLPFTLQPLRHGAYGVLLKAPVARTLGRWPRLRSFQITLGRRYRSHGASRSYLSAHCPLPPRFHSLSVPLARATYHFAPAPTISTPILRACRVRD
jgi:hypothetical protein